MVYAKAWWYYAWILWIHNLLPSGLKLTADDTWDVVYVLSVKIILNLQGRLRRLSSRQTNSFVADAVKNAFSLWLNQFQIGELLAEMAVSSAQRRMRT